MSQRKGKKKQIFSEKKKPKSLQKKTNFSFPFLEQNATVVSIRRQFRIMFIMRGLPGSGKSSLVKEIIKVYPNAVVCSADHYFMENDRYVWSIERRHYAHQYCMKLAEKCCEMNCPFVIIDNTNISEIEVRAYLEMASKYSSFYVTLFVLPQTSWRFDPVQLEKHGTHNVPLKSLKMKLKHFEDILPEFYAWFIGEQDAQTLKAFAIHLFKECLKHFSRFQAEISKLQVEQQNSNDKQKELENHFQNKFKEPFFSIVKNCLKGKAVGSHDFHSREDVQSSCGKVFVLQVSKMLVSTNSIIACVELTSQQKRLYDRLESESCENKEDSYEVIKNNSKQGKPQNEEPISTGVGYTDDEEMHRLCMERIETMLSQKLSTIQPGENRETLQEIESVIMPEKSGKSFLEKTTSPDGEKIAKKSIENPRKTEISLGINEGEKCFDFEAFKTEDGEMDKGEVSWKVVEAKNGSKNSSKKPVLAAILLTENGTVDSTNCLRHLKNALEMEPSINDEPFEKISTNESDIVYLDNGQCLVHLKKYIQVDAIFSALY